MLERFLLVWLCLLSLAAFYWTDWFATDAEHAVFDPFMASKAYLQYVIALTMMAIGWMLPHDELRQVARRWPMVLAGTAIQFASMPALAYLMGRLFQLDDDAMLGIIMVGCVPGAMASNVLTLVARGNISYSLSLTTSATLLSPVLVTVALLVTLGERIDFPTTKVTWSLCWTVVVPVVVGHLLSRRFASFQTAGRRVGTIVANLAILWIIAVVVGVNRDQLGQTSYSVVGALVCLNLLGYAAGYAGAAVLRLPKPMQRALTLEIGMQNAGLGAWLALNLFAGREAAAIPTAMYTFGCMLTGTILARYWANSTAPEQEGDKSQNRP